MTNLKYIYHKLKREFKKTNITLSSIFLKRIKIASYENVEQELNYPIEYFSCSNPNYHLYCKTTPYWAEFQKIELRQNHTQITETEVVGKGILINKSSEVLLESTISQLEYLNKLNSNHFIYFKNLFFYKKIDYAIVLSNYLENNYFHWVLESIGRIAMVAPDILTKYFIVIDSKSSSFVKESLIELFNINPNKIILKKEFSRLKIKNTLIPTFPLTRNLKTNWTNIYSTVIIKKINEISKLKTTKTKQKNFIISRKKTWQRRILNQGIITKQFPLLNFEIIILEELTFKEQMDLFSNANIIIATHGAGLTNLIFANKPLIIELFPKNRLIRDAFYFYQISQVLNFKHHIIEYNPSNSFQDLTLDSTLINKLKKIIEDNPI